MRRKREDERGATLSPGDGTAERLRLEAAQLLHKIRRLHEGDVGEMEVAKDLVLEAARPLLAGARQVDAASVATEALLVVDVVVVDARRLCIVKTTKQHHKSTPNNSLSIIIIGTTRKEMDESL